MWWLSDAVDCGLRVIKACAVHMRLFLREFGIVGKAKWSCLLEIPEIRLESVSERKALAPGTGAPGNSSACS